MQYSLVFPRYNIRELLFFVLALIIVSLTPFIKIYTPLSPVPFVIQNICFLTYAAWQGRKKALMLAGAYIYEGIMGIPVFVAANSGFHFFASPTAGYIMGYAIASYVVGFLFEKKIKTYFWTCLALLLGALIIILSGVGFLSIWWGWKRAFLLGGVPFIGIDIIKCFFAALWIFSIKTK